MHKTHYPTQQFIQIENCEQEKFFVIKFSCFYISKNFNISKIKNNKTNIDDMISESVLVTKNCLKII